MSEIKEMVDTLNRIIEKAPDYPYCPIEPDWIPMLTEIKEIVEKSESESLCDDCEWFKNPGACPDYDESKCRYNAPMEEDR